jgi:hypothetical protein
MSSYGSSRAMAGDFSRRLGRRLGRSAAARAVLLTILPAIFVAPAAAARGAETPATSPGEPAAKTAAKSATEASPEGIAFFEKKIRPILIEHCYACHSGESKKSEGGLLVDSREALLKGGDSGPAITPRDPDQSLLMVAVRHADKDLKMPPDGKLPAVHLADLAAWIKMGAPDPRLASSAAAVARPKYGMSLEEGRAFWSFKPVRSTAVPPVKNGAWPRNSVDRFILAKLEAEGIAPAPPADPRTLLRRVTFDLTGLPPTPEEMAAFLADDSPRAFEKAVDRLLASPRYGERWGRHWLDVVRYADTCGNASDYPVPQAHKYRDWVIGAFNRDLPYDQFVREQIAGDLLADGSEAERYQRVVATGYLAIARRFGGGRVGEPHLTIEDTIDNLGRAVLGVSLACARCHDHKFDPFTMDDYYGLYGIFGSTRYPFPGAEGSTKQQDFVPLMKPEAVEALLKPHREQAASVEADYKKAQAAEAEAKKAAESPEKAARVTAATQAVAEAKKKLDAVSAAAPAIDDAYAVAEGQPADARVQLRGDPKRLGDEVPRHFPAILGGQTLPTGAKGGGRLELASWLTDRSNPLTARVLVNRIWQHHFGRGLVPTPNDFGRQGAAPSHPELLDHLATEFMEGGWSIKELHRLILTSATWRQSSAASEENLSRDPENQWWGRYTRRRLDAESLRDALLFVGGELDETTTGGHPFPAAASWRYTQHNPFAAVYETKRRSIYLMQSRLKKHPYLALFDGADPNAGTGARLPSTTPLQALFFMNDPLAHQAAAGFAARVMKAAPDEAARLDHAYAIAFGRKPTADELHECGAFLDRYRTELGRLKTPATQIDETAWSALGRVLLGGNEFLYVD